MLNRQMPSALVRCDGLQALILDWAGTVVDFGSLAPVLTLQRVFAKFHIELPEEQARRDMGLPKRDHIARILSIPEISRQWRNRYGSNPERAAIDEIYAAFIPLQLACLAEYSAVIPGVVPAVERARVRGLKIGSNTGYTREMLDLLVTQAAAEGYRPECSLSPDDVQSGRPEPLMIFEIAVRLKVYPLAAIVKIGDTPADIQEALNAGVWSIGVARTGNMIGLSQAELEDLPKGDQQQLVSEARGKLEAAGAHFVIDSVAEMDGALDEIERLLQV